MPIYQAFSRVLNTFSIGGGEGNRTPYFFLYTSVLELLTSFIHLFVNKKTNQKVSPPLLFYVFKNSAMAWWSGSDNGIPKASHFAL